MYPPILSYYSPINDIFGLKKTGKIRVADAALPQCTEEPQRSPGMRWPVSGRVLGARTKLTGQNRGNDRQSVQKLGEERG